MFRLAIDARLELALVHTDFAQKYLEIVSEERDYLSEWLAWPPHADNESFFLTFIQRSLHDYADGKSMVCAMLYDGVVVGNISFNSIDYHVKKATIGYWLSSHYTGQGIVTKSVKKLVEIAFKDLKLNKVQISVAEHNKRSRAVCERLGFTLEGIITQAENLNGRIVDHAVYGLHYEPTVIS